MFFLVTKMVDRKPFGNWPRNNAKAWPRLKEVVPIGFPPPEPKIKKGLNEMPVSAPAGKITEWLSTVPDKPELMSPPPVEEIEESPELREHKKAYDGSYVQGPDTGVSSFTISSNSASPFELKLAEVTQEVIQIEKEKNEHERLLNEAGWPNPTPEEPIDEQPSPILKEFSRLRPEKDVWKAASHSYMEREPYPVTREPPKLPRHVFPVACKPVSRNRLESRRSEMERFSACEQPRRVFPMASKGAFPESRPLETRSACWKSADGTALLPPHFKPEERVIREPPQSAVFDLSTIALELEKDDEKRARLIIPENLDENVDAARTLANANKKFKKREGEEHKKVRAKVDDLLEMDDYDSGLSGEIRSMDSHDNKFEASELIEYRDHSWCIAVPIEKEKTQDKDMQQLLVFSSQSFIDRLLLTTEQASEVSKTLLIKYRRVNGNVEVVPVYSAQPSTGLISLKYRHNKGIEMRLYGLVSFVDFVKDPMHNQYRTMVWTDALGPIYLTAADRANIRRKLMNTEEKTFAPLRMCQMTVKGEFTLSVPNGNLPKWNVASFQPLIEEGPKDPNIGRNLWPARVLRFDDLILDKPRGKETWLKSYSDRKVIVFAGAHLHGVLNSAGPAYTEHGVMMGFVVPVFIRNRFAYYEALVVGPPRVLMVLTEGRYLNYTPKTWPPSVETMRKEYQREHEEKRLAREEPRWTTGPRSTSPLKSIMGFNEFHFDLQN
ncbi:unnamed protein product [Caenorhabditis sp. 36 PRJEB53466]|nr:unnamed protein product [Caenorhabditis sp. 36 PRJEB53466]